ncbi:MAG: hypothetical protein AAFU49_19375, partial [Pseudomonadota bacterium]
SVHSSTKVSRSNLVTADVPKPGQVIDYHYLWKWQADRGETEGRKKRPACVVVVVKNTAGRHVLFIAPITSKHPDEDRTALQIPETEARRATLATHLPLWVIVDELNADVLETSYTLEDRAPRGAFSPPFTEAILQSIQHLRQSAKLRVANRS